MSEQEKGFIRKIVLIVPKLSKDKQSYREE